MCFLAFSSISIILVWQFTKGKLNPEEYGLKTTDYDMLSPAQQFAIGAGIEKAKIIRSSNMETIDFNLEDYKHLAKNANEQEVNSNDDDDDDDNVA